MSNIHTNIKILREEARLSQEEFADKVGVSLETVKLWEKGKLDPTSSEITIMCPILRIHEEDFLERDILSERNEAGDMMKKSQNRNTYNWYYGDRKIFAFYLSYLIIIPLAIIFTFLIIGALAKMAPAEPSDEFINPIVSQIMASFLVEGFISAIYIIIYMFKRRILRFQWWYVFWISPALGILTIIAGIGMIGLYGFAFYKAVIKKGKNI